jgi:hypothetical protein
MRDNIAKTIADTIAIKKPKNQSIPITTVTAANAIATAKLVPPVPSLISPKYSILLAQLLHFTEGGFLSLLVNPFFPHYILERLGL